MAIFHTRQVFFFITLITSQSLIAQELPKFIQDGLSFCDSNLSKEQTTQLRKEINNLEDYFVTKGLLANKSGTSYKAVYEQIIREDGLNFEIDTTFELLETVDFQALTNCFYKLLTPRQLNQFTIRHQESIEEILEGYSGNLALGLVAQQILDNLKEEYFEFKFYQTFSLLIFYQIASSVYEAMVVLPKSGQSLQTSTLSTIKVFLNEENRIIVDGSERTQQQLEHLIYEFLKIKPSSKGIEISTSQNASYISYLDLLSAINSVYDNIMEQFDNEISKNIILKESE